MRAEDKIRQYMQEVGTATRPQIAEATGLSVVAVGKAVQQLCLNGEMRAAGRRPSGGGRPVELYRYNARHAACLLISVQREGVLWVSTLAALDMQGNVQTLEELRHTQIQPQSFDEHIDALQKKKKLLGIYLHLPPELPQQELQTHLRGEYGCPVGIITGAEAVAEKQEETLTLLLQQGKTPSAVICRHGSLQSAGALHLLPCPTPWETLPYSDHTLVEEMVSRLLQQMLCLLQPARVYLFADFWTERLVSRIRYNTSAKLQGMEQLPRLHFRALKADTLAVRMAKAAAARAVLGK